MLPWQGYYLLAVAFALNAASLAFTGDVEALNVICVFGSLFLCDVCLEAYVDKYQEESNG